MDKYEPKGFARGALAVSHEKDADWDDGLRDYFAYRDLGMMEKTGGKLRAHVIRPSGPCKEQGDQHYHKVDFQMIYVLKGWVRFVYHVEDADGGETEVRECKFGPGDCCLQPPGILHNELECSDDLELIEITSPAAYETVAE